MYVKLKNNRLEKERCPARQKGLASIHFSGIKWISTKAASPCPEEEIDYLKNTSLERFKEDLVFDNIFPFPFITRSTVMTCPLLAVPLQKTGKR